MAGYVRGSKAHYKFLIRVMLDISEKLKSSDVTQEEKGKLFIKQSEFMNQLEKYFPNGEPK